MAAPDPTALPSTWLQTSTTSGTLGALGGVPATCAESVADTRAPVRKKGTKVSAEFGGSTPVLTIPEVAPSASSGVSGGAAAAAAAARDVAASPAAAAAAAASDVAASPAAAPTSDAVQEEQEEEERAAEVAAGRKKTFDPYWSEEQIRRGLQEQRLVQGVLRISTRKLGTAHVKPNDTKASKEGTSELFVLGKKARNRAVHGDVVIVAPLDTDEVDVDSDLEEIRFPMAGRDQASNVAEPASEGDRRLWKVVAIPEPKGRNRVIICTLHPNRPQGKSDASEDQLVGAKDSFLQARPTDSRMPWMLIKITHAMKQKLQLPGRLDRFQLWPTQLLAWNETSSLPLAVLKGECLGQAGDLDAEEKHALIEHELDSHDVDFSDEQLDEVDNIVREAHATFESEASNRLDLRKKRIFTIDPATARDLDDAIHVDRIDRNQVEIGVHIADVGHFLKLGSLTDKEAQRRTTSVYLLNRVLPMLPHGLCNHLCSLNPNEPKLAFSAFFRLDLHTGELIQDPKPWFRKTVISSVCRLNYDEAQDVLDGKEIEVPPVYGEHTWEEIKDDLHLLYEVCGKVRSGRFEGGALTLSKVKMVFHTRESADGLPTGYHLEHHSASHWVIEELMLLANRCVAKHLAHSHLSEVAVLRNHEAPDGEKAQILATRMRDNLGLRWESESAGSLYRTFRYIEQRFGSMLARCMEMMTMRAGMKQATYFVYDREANSHHFALNFDYYTHFTSPIRRYPDIMVHRVLDALLQGSHDGFQEREEAVGQCEICNEKKLASRRCNEQLDRAVFCVYLRQRKEWFYTVGTVLSMQTSEGMDETVTVYCSQLGRESRIVLTNIASRYSQLFTEGVQDEVLLPDTWKSHGRGGMELQWKGRPETVQLRMLCCVPVVIVPTNTVPVDYAMFFVPPFHPKYKDVRAKVSDQEARGFEWREAPADGVQVQYSHGDVLDPSPVVDPDDFQ